MNTSDKKAFLLNIDQYYKECYQELLDIADWWQVHVVNAEKGTFFGEVDDNNNGKADANRGSVLSARLLWFFSEAARVTENSSYVKTARFIYDFLEEHFVDKVNGGIYWEIDAKGQIVNSKKQVYAQAFYIYGLCAFYRLTGEKEALDRALKIFRLLETHAHDDKNLGYVDALNKSWGPQEDLRLSSKEPNLPKTMNTHLHVLEAYTVLNLVITNEKIAASLRRVLHYLMDRFYDDETGHLKLFYDENWNDKSTGYSYGHDLESSWLMLEAAESLNDKKLLQQVRSIVPRIARVVMKEGSGEYGELLDGYDFTDAKIVREHLWWVQAEALIGYLNAFQVSGDKEFIEAFLNTWKFIKKYQRNNEHGEWHWFAKVDLKEQKQNYKAGFWKAPYHNGRAMMEVCRRLREIQITNT